MNGWSVKRFLMMVGLTAVSVMVAVTVDHNAAVQAGAPPVSAGPLPAAGAATTSVTDYSYAATPAIHAANSGKCVKSSPNC